MRIQIEAEGNIPSCDIILCKFYNLILYLDTNKVCKNKKHQYYKKRVKIFKSFIIAKQ